MRLTRRHQHLRQKHLLFAFIFGFLALFSVGYAAFSTTLTLNAKGNIVKNKKAASMLKKTVVTTGDGLYDVGNGRYVYKGADPANYITFSGSTWRIVSVEANNTIKIIRTGNDLTMTSSSTSSEWNDSDINTYLNGTYYNGLSQKDYVATSSDFNYETWHLADYSYVSTATWNGNVALLGPSEYIAANTNDTQCSSSALISANLETCKTTNYLIDGDIWTLLAKYEDGSSYKVMVSNGEVKAALYSGTHVLRPVLYLKSDVEFDGEGTSSQPYSIKSGEVVTPIEEPNYAADTLLKLGNPTIVTSDSGLYKDGDRYVYRGSSPDNYIRFSGEIWRIVSIESDGSIKIIKDEKLDTDMAFDKNNGSRQSGYCAQNGYCNAWMKTDNFINGSAEGSVSADASINTYLNSYLSGLSQSGLVKTDKEWNVGGSISVYNDDISLSDLKSREETTKWTGSIALLTISEYLNANSDSNCMNPLDLSNNRNTCKTTNYLFKSGYWWWLLSPTYNTASSVTTSQSSGIVSSNGANYGNGTVRPVVYLSKDVTITGSGTNDENIYTVS